LFERAIALLVMALLLGYLGEQQKRLRAEKTVITTMLSKARVEAGMTATLQAVLRDIGQLYEARNVRIAALEARDSACLRGSCGGGRFQWLNANVLDRERYLFEIPAVVWYAKSSGRSVGGYGHRSCWQPAAQFAGGLRRAARAEVGCTLDGRG